MLIPAGNHKNYTGAATNGTKWIAWCSNLAIYVAAIDSWQIKHIIAHYLNAITSFEFSPNAEDLLVCTSLDNVVTIWNVSTEEGLYSLKLDSAPLQAQWCKTEPDKISIYTENGILRIWNFMDDVVHVYKDVNHSSVNVLRWSSNVLGAALVLAAGHADSSISFVDVTQKRVKRLKCQDKSNGGHEGGVNDFKWDPLSTSYGIAAFGSGTLSLIDYEKMEQIKTFEKSPGGIKCVEWNKSSPGTFFTVSGTHASMRMWNVSQHVPLQIFKLGYYGFRSISMLPNGSQLLVGGAEGDVGVFDVSKKKWVHQFEVGHSETIFACEFAPNNKNILATGSFDGVIKLWDVTTFRCIATMKPQGGGTLGIIYSLAWSSLPDDHRIACSTSQGYVHIFETEGKSKGALVLQRKNHKGLVYCVGWSPHRDLLASGGEDGYCVLYHPQPDESASPSWMGKGLKEPHAPSPLLSTTCLDWGVRLFDVQDPANYQKLKEFRHHSAKAFSVKFSPLVPGLLASSSDDCRVAVWRVEEEKKVVVLEGHTNKTRALSWHYEIPFILLSGSWDGCIRVWDIRGSGSCLLVVMDHHADVYGLSSHPERPFLFASSSRDTTLRFWSAEQLTPSIHLRAVVSNDWRGDGIAGPLPANLEEQDATCLCGSGAAKLAEQLGACKSDLERWALKCSFLLFPDGVQELFCIMDNSESRVPLLVDNRVMHAKSILPWLLRKAQELEQARGGFAGIGRMTRNEAMVKAANIYARIGYMRQYCDLMVEAGEIEKALLVAPAVSLSYWQDLARKYAGMMAERQEADCVPLLVASGQHGKAAEFLVSHAEDLDSALAIAQANCEHGYERIARAIHASSGQEEQETGKALPTQESAEERLEMRRETVKSMKMRYKSQGQPVLAACVHLAIGEDEEALKVLVDAHELELAIALCTLVRASEGLRHGVSVPAAMQGQREGGGGEDDCAVEL
ncbi:hypothetical protein GUITHDRAFT_136844 [Guillardia theta CCMP2712]|uniref:Uncharacterized protein n=1 Tax=Guillardia theta (strain CCMP2712) TaxID=905079 RepID=L1JJ61_GUITC|nr:hypothetical protein GUITHDRAFT_136844 [Guillardia theta CCMP2712]EKX48332.1 hypothetical protein GUITHDRAFT_136844 [Guillardia theta CCMP2712]|eukprot:XP_005835312.1 hypothetical protein GUITHDRAFT_136844 [Guillardia theta CCMP2712]